MRKKQPKTDYRSITLSLLTIGLVVFLAWAVTAIGVAKEFYASGSDGTRSINGATCEGQTFTPGTVSTGNFNLDTVQLFLGREAIGGAQIINVKITSTSAGLPTTTILSSNTTANIQSITAAPGTQAINISMPPVVVQQGVKYGITVCAPSNTIVWLADTDGSGGAYAGGSRVTSADTGATWSEPSTSDEHYFYTFGTPDTTIYLNTTLVTPLNQTTTLNPSLIFNVTLQPTNAQSANVTLSIWYANGTLFNSYINTTLSATNSSLINVTNFTLGSYKWSAFGCATNATDSKCVSSPSNYTFDWGYQINQEAWDNVTSVGLVTPFQLNLTVNSSYQINNAFITWNGTQYSATIAQDGMNYTLTKLLTVPFYNSSFATNFTWTVVFNTGFNFTRGLFPQQVNIVSLDNCTVNTMVLMNMTMFDEDALNAIGGIIELTATMYTPGTSNTVGVFNFTYNYNPTPANAKVCIGNLNGTYALDYQTRYYGNATTSAIYAIENKYGQNIVISNNTIPLNIKLYPLNVSSSTAFVINVQGSDLSAVTGAVVDIQRQYVGLNQFISVESPLTDSSGKTIGHMLAKNAVYDFAVYKNGVLLGTFNNYLVKCQNEVTNDCTIDLNLADATYTLSDYSNYGNISALFSFSKPNRLLTMSFLSTDGIAHNVSWIVVKSDAYANTTICTNTVLGSTGQFTCSVPQSYGNSSIYTQLYSDGTFLGRNYYSLAPAYSDILGGTKVVLGMLMYSCLALLIMHNPVTIVLGAIIGMIFAFSFHIIDGGSFLGNTSIIMWFIIAGAIILFGMRNKI